MGLFSLFSRFKARPAPKHIPLPVDEDWKPGDLAECLHGGPWFEFGAADGCRTGPDRGEIHCVSLVTAGYWTGRVVIGLRFTRWPRSFEAGAFRKISPRADVAERAHVDWVGDILKHKEPADA